MKASDQLSIRYFSNLMADGSVAVPRRFGELYTTFLVEDISSSVWPFAYRSSRRNVSVQLKTNSESAEEIVTAALGRNERSLESSIQEFLSAAAGQIAEFDFAVAEIVFTRDADNNEIENVQCVWINPVQIYRRWGKVYQQVPLEVASERGVKTRIHLPNEKIIHFLAPSRFRKAMSRARESLRIVSDFGNRSFALTAFQTNLPFDWQIHERAMMLALAEAGKPIGFASRGMFNKHVATPYWIRMRLLHERFLIELRQSLLDTLNNALKRIGSRMGFECELKVDGFPTDRDIEIALNQLDSGSLPLVKLMDVYS
jgi:hypothetical protein